MRNRYALMISAVALLGGLAYLFWPNTNYCVSAVHDYGMTVPVCPTGEPRQIVSVYGRGLVRGGDGEVSVSVRAKYTTAKADEALNHPVEKFTVKLFIVNALGEETPLPNQNKKWQVVDETQSASVKLPALDDGDYLLRSKVSSKIGEEVVDVKLALYSPARIHVLSDRPIYEPGNVVQFRALALRASDLSPIDNRPGTWLVRSPSGEILLEERAPAGEWGVVAGDFPLADDAEVGSWSVAWRSGKSEETTSFVVEPFVLPRFRVEANSGKGFYKAGERPTLDGTVVYGSGAPVANATLELSWSASGAWPPPTEWIDGEALPRSATSGADGRFTLTLPEVPADLQGRCTLRANISAVDPAGDRVASSASILLSEDAIAVTAVTELRGGLVASNNNRVYLRVTDPVGAAISGAEINVKRAWSPGDKGLDAELDADGVARIQFDPGRPIAVVIPPMPVRASAKQESAGVEISELRDLVFDAEVTLKDQIALEKWPFERCSRWVGAGDSMSSTLMFRVSPAGVVTSPTTNDDLLAECVGNVAKSQRLPLGRDRIYSANISIPGSNDASIEGSIDSDFEIPEDLESIVATGAALSRPCLPRSGNGDVPWALFFETKANSKKLVFSWLKKTESEAVMPAGLGGCILSGLRPLELEEPAAASAIGVIEYQLFEPGQEGEEEYRPQARIMQGYELSVTATKGDQELGATKFRMTPGSIPNLRLRATPVMAKPGQTIELSFIRGPEYRGKVPRDIAWSHHGDYEVIKLKKDAHKASYELPEDAKGWYRFYAGGAQALVFVRSEEDLSVSVSPGSPSYVPGAMATLSVKTMIGEQGAKAAVGLFGVDNSLSQIATLRGPDDLGSLRPPIVMQEKAFGALDAQALTLGRIRGANAAEATILRVESIPSPGEVDVLLYESAETKFDPIEELTDHFYIVLAQLHVQTRAWEKSAAKGETMSPKKMAALWKEALDACKKRGQDVTDAYKRPLRLHWLPSDLLALTAPRQVVADATRLPEDVENWQAWVAKERP